MELCSLFVFLFFVALLNQEVNGSESGPQGTGHGMGDHPPEQTEPINVDTGSDTGVHSWATLSAKGPTFNIYSFCTSQVDEFDCGIPEGQCFWDKNVSACFIEETRIQTYTGLELCEFYVEVVPTMTNENTEPYCQNREQYTNRLNKTCDEILIVDEDCTASRGVSLNPQMPPVKLYSAYVCCESCGDPMDRMNTTIIPSQCENYDPNASCFDEIEGCDHIVSNDLCLLVSGCDESCGFCDACNDLGGPLECGIYRSVPEPDCTAEQSERCANSCRRCPHPGFCDLSIANVQIYDSTTEETYIIPSLGAAFGPVAYNLEFRSLMVITDLCNEISDNAQLSGLVALTGRGDCSFETKVKNAQDAGAVFVLISNTFKNADLIFMNSDDPDDGAKNITIPSRFLDYNLQFDNVIKSRSSATNFNVEIQCSINFYPNHLCVRNTGEAQVNGEYALAGYWNGEPYYRSWRYNGWVYLHWNGRWSVSNQLLSSYQNVYPLLHCVTRNNRNGQAENDLLKCSDWIFRYEDPRPDVLISQTVKNKRCGNECNGSEIRSLFDEIDSDNCKNFASYGKEQSDYVCQCVEDLWAAGINPVDYPCTIVSQNLGAEALNCLDSGFVSVSIDKSLTGELCTTPTRESHFTNWCSEKITDGNIWSEKYVCDLRTNRTAVAMWPYSNNCGIEDGEEIQIWTWLDEPCAKVNASHRQDEAFIKSLVGDYTMVESRCGLPEGSSLFETTAEASASTSNLLILVSVLFCFFLI